MENYNCALNKYNRYNSYGRYIGYHRYDKLNDYINCLIVDLENYRQIGRVDRRAIDDDVLLQVCRDVSIDTNNTLDCDDCKDIARGMIIKMQDEFIKGFRYAEIKKAEPAIPKNAIDCIVGKMEYEYANSDCM